MVNTGTNVRLVAKGTRSSGDTVPPSASRTQLAPAEAHTIAVTATSNPVCAQSGQFRKLRRSSCHGRRRRLSTINTTSKLPVVARAAIRSGYPSRALAALTRQSTSTHCPCPRSATTSIVCTPASKFCASGIVTAAGASSYSVMYARPPLS